MLGDNSEVGITVSPASDAACLILGGARHARPGGGRPRRGARGWRGAGAVARAGRHHATARGCATGSTTFRPEVVVNCAAFTTVDDCESEPDAALRGQRRRRSATSRPRRAQAGARLVHVSTDYVFDGAAREPYREDASDGAALGLRREQARGRAAGARLRRARWWCGRAGSSAPAARTSSPTIAGLIARRRAPLRVVDDQVGCPTYTPFLARALLAIWRAGAQRASSTTATASRSPGTASPREIARPWSGRRRRGRAGHHRGVPPSGAAARPTRCSTSTASRRPSGRRGRALARGARPSYLEPRMTEGVRCMRASDHRHHRLRRLAPGRVPARRAARTSRSSAPTAGAAAMDNIEHLRAISVKLLECDLRDYTSVHAGARAARARTAIFHLAAQSFVPSSWNAPSRDADRPTSPARPTSSRRSARWPRPGDPDRLLVARSTAWCCPDEVPIKETNPLRPLSPYAVSKVAQDYPRLPVLPELRHQGRAHARLQPHRPAARRGLRDLELRQAGGVDRGRAAGAGDPGRQPRRDARLHRRARHGARLLAGGRPRASRARSTTSPPATAITIREMLDQLLSLLEGRGEGRDRSRRACARRTSRS